MRNNLLILLGILYLITNAYAFDYQTVYPNRIAYFTNSSGVHCIKIDSAKLINNDSVLYPFKNIQQIDFQCFTPYGASWMGNKILVNKDFNVFFNQNNDTIRIKTNAIFNESWQAYRSTDSVIVIAKIVKYDTSSFMGMVDSVKTISFQAFEKTMKPLDLEINYMSIRISKHFGLIRTINFLLFPNFVSQFYYQEIEQYDLVGMTNPKLGTQNITWFDVFDFNPNDEIHISTNDNHVEPTSGSGTSLYEKVIFRYLSKKTFNDSIQYNVEVKTERSFTTFKNNISNTSNTFSHDSIIQTITRNDEFDVLPDVPIINFHLAYCNGMNESSKATNTLASISKSSDSCWHEIIYDGCFYVPRYFKGLGGPYYSCRDFNGLGGENVELVYYKKGDKTWGTPLVITNIKEEANEQTIKVFPNPTIGNITIESEPQNLPAVFELRNSNSNVVFTCEIKENLKSVNLNIPVTGLYFYTLTHLGSVKKSGKLFIKF